MSQSKRDNPLWHTAKSLKQGDQVLIKTPDTAKLLTVEDPPFCGTDSPFFDDGLYVILQSVYGIEFTLKIPKTSHIDPLLIESDGSEDGEQVIHIRPPRDIPGTICCDTTAQDIGIQPL